MHFDNSQPASTSTEVHSGPWYQDVTRYQWFVLTVAALGWMFDTMDQQLFNLARKPALEELLKLQRGDLAVNWYAGWATTIFMIGWALGGLYFGILGDRIGRAKTMLLTIVLYSAFTGLSALSKGFLDFAVYRFLTGLGVGGEFAVGVSLVAEVMPDRARPHALGWLQALSAVGNIIAALSSIALGRMEEEGMIGSAWRAMFIIGLLPALLTLIVFRWLREPDRWKAAAAKRAADAEAGIVGEEPKMGSLRELFGDPRWRRNTIVGMALAFAGVVGLWGIGFFTFDLTRTVFFPHFMAEAKRLDLVGAEAEKYVNGKLTFWSGMVSLLLNTGAFFGIYAFSRVTQVIGRRPAFAISFLLAMGSTAFTFWFLDDFTEIFWMIPIMGFCQLTLFGGYAIYFPELFPTRLRSTGTSFCYNVGRLVAAVGPLTLGHLTSQVFAHHKATDVALPFRYAGVTMCLVFVIGLIALPFAPETKGKPLPE